METNLSEPLTEKELRVIELGLRMYCHDVHKMLKAGWCDEYEAHLALADVTKAETKLGITNDPIDEHIFNKGNFALTLISIANIDDSEKTISQEIYDTFSELLNALHVPGVNHSKLEMMDLRQPVEADKKVFLSERAFVIPWAVAEALEKFVEVYKRQQELYKQRNAQIKELYKKLNEYES